MKKKIYSMIILLLIVVSACKTDEFLEPTPYGVATDEGFLINESQAIQGINSTYRNLREWYNGFNGDYAFGNIGTDDAWKGGSDVGDNPDLAVIEGYSITPASGGITGRWSNSFQGIRNANNIIEKVPLIDDMNAALRERIVGEAYFLRGVYYFDLAKYFGGAPIFPENLATQEEYLTVPKNTEEEVWAFVEESLVEATKRLPKKSEYEAKDTGRATIGAALGFLVRANLYQNDMTDVKKYSEDLFDLGEYSLAPTYAEIFTPDGENGPGSIFEVQFIEQQQGWGNALGNTCGTAFGPRKGDYGGWGFTMARQELLDEFEENDPRLDYSFFKTVDQVYGPIDDNGTAYFGRKVAYEPHSKYPVPNAANDGPVNWRVIRLADIYLSYAEAVASTDPSTAMEYVNKVRRRAREGNNNILPDLTGLNGQALMDAIYHERRIELNLEGHRFQDLVRTGRTSILEPYGFTSGKHEKMPIPQAEIDNFGGVLEQNNGY